MNLYDTNNDELLAVKSEMDELQNRSTKLSDLSSSINKKKSELKEKESDLEEYKEEYEKYRRLKNRTQREIEKLQKQILTSEIQLNKFSATKDSDEERMGELRPILRDLLTEELVNRIFTISEDNVIIKYLSNDTKTTPIMDEFYHSDKDFLALCCHEWGCGGYNFIITRRNYMVNTHELEPTMTELKKNDGTRLADLRSCKESALRVYRETGQKYLPFDKPCLLGGQTYSNQTGYGWEWSWGNLIWEGTHYGETTGFYIIGIIMGSIDF